MPTESTLPLRGRMAGVFAPISTPFSDDEEVDYKALTFNVERYAATGLLGYLVFSCWMRYWLSAIGETIFRRNVAPDASSFWTLATLLTGVKAVFVLAVYVLPIFTLPLLPMVV